MGPRHSTHQLTNEIGISGNHNIALMLNGVNYNLSSVFIGAVDRIVEGYRSDLIRVHFASAFLILIITSMMIRCLISRHRVEKREIIQLKLRDFLNMFLTLL